jgi:glycosyltransferase involved in cell wall biosynthesis
VITTISCGAPYGQLGLGKHLAQIVEDARQEGCLTTYFAHKARAGDVLGVNVSSRALPLLLNYSPARFRPDWRTALSAELFDRAVASQLKQGDALIAFSGQALSSFQTARRLGFSTLELESPTGHMQHVLQQQRRAEESGIERGWAGSRLVKRALREYELADVIIVTSEYAHESFLERGIPADRLKRRSLSVDSRFVPDVRARTDDKFRVVYVGALTTMKGVHVLLDAFSRCDERLAQLTLVGGWATRGMRRFIDKNLSADPRIRIRMGDPLSYLQEADVCVHPSFHDGFGLAPMEALACGTSVIVTEDTGMKEHVRQGSNGFVIPTGDAAALFEHLEIVRTGGLPTRSRHKALTSELM